MIEFLQQKVKEDMARKEMKIEENKEKRKKGEKGI